MSLSFFVPGIPVAQGNKRAFPRKAPGGKMHVAMVESTKGIHEWRSLVALAARQATRKEGGAWWFKREPLSVQLVFVLPRPVSLSKKVHGHVRKPDLSKLIRAVEDAMTDIVYGDDSQIVRLVAHKQYPKNADYGEAPGVAVLVEEENP